LAAIAHRLSCQVNWSAKDESSFKGSRIVVGDKLKNASTMKGLKLHGSFILNQQQDENSTNSLALLKELVET